MQPTIILAFDAGTVTARIAGGQQELPDPWVYDERVNRWRVPAYTYRTAFMQLHELDNSGEITLVDEARQYDEIELQRQGDKEPRTYQQEAMETWLDHGQQGQIVLPTGAGKSFVAHLIMEQLQRSTLIVVPTIDLMNQWYSTTLAIFGLDEVGLLGGGHHDIAPVTITTYDSAFLHMERYGDRFGFVVFDECHHLPGESYSQGAQSILAPFRLGLTATPERHDGSKSRNDELIGPIAYRKRIRSLSGDFLSQYQTETIRVSLTDEEREEYEDERARYLDFIRSNRIRMSSARGWGNFIALTSRSRQGRRAMRAYQRQRNIALGCSQKIRTVERILFRHSEDRIILFTNDNDTVYNISRRLLIPAITHQTPTRERKEILDRFNDGSYRAVVTSRVLNEGVDVPEANVAVILSGSSTVREHVQRLGRILRPRDGKQATLYEVIATNTVEERVSKRRRKHDAYRQ